MSERPDDSTPQITAARGPLLLSTWSFGERANAAAWPAFASGGSAVDAVEAVTVFCDDDPGIDSVGYGGLPDSDGQMSLDGCLMTSPEQCGSVCAVRTHRHPVQIARLVMDLTPHFRKAQQGRGEMLEERNGQLAVVDQETGKVWVTATPTSHDLPSEIYALFEAQPDVRESLFFDEGHPDDEGFTVFAKALMGPVSRLLPEPKAR